MVLWDDKQNWQNITQTQQEKEQKTQINKIRKEKGKVIDNDRQCRQCRITKDHKKSHSSKKKWGERLKSTKLEVKQERFQQTM